jgi:DNA-binding MarR family transcriptional regulator
MHQLLAETTILELVTLQTHFQKRISAALSIHGLGMSDYLVLNQLNQAPLSKMQRNELAQSIGLSPSGITRLLNPLEKIGLVEKESAPRDARVSLVTLTVSGKQIYDDAKISFVQVSKVLLKALDKAQLAEFSQLIKTVF